MKKEYIKNWILEKALGVVTLKPCSSLNGSWLENVTSVFRPMEEGLAFSLSLDRKLHADLTLVALCPTQDIVACCFSDQISCHRLNWQKIWTHQVTECNGPPSAIHWHPDAALLAVGFCDGFLLLLEPERGEVRSKTKVGAHRITTLSWTEETRSYKGRDLRM